MRILRICSMCLALLTCLCTSGLGQQKLPTSKKPPITASNYRWTTYQNGWVDLSCSLHNNTKNDVHKVNYRVIFYGSNGEPIHFEEGWAGRIPAGLAVMETVTLMDGGLNIYHSTARLRVEVLSYEGGTTDGSG